MELMDLHMLDLKGFAKGVFNHTRFWQAKRQNQLVTVCVTSSLWHSDEVCTNLHNEVALPVQAKEEEMIVYGIFSIINCFCIYRVRRGWRHLERTVNFIHIYAEKV